MLRYLLGVVVTATLCSLSACGEVHDGQAAMRAANDATLTDFQKYVALSGVSEQMGCDGLTIFSGRDRDCLDLKGRVAAQATNHLGMAVAAGDVKAARELLGDSYIQRATMERFSAAILSRADGLQGAKSEEAKIYLRLAGAILRDGIGVPRNYDRAVTFYRASWVAGESDAAGLVAGTYEQARDVKNAYLWALRCGNACAGGPWITATTLERQLDAASIKLIQSKAADGSVMSL
ncbi:MULTISPECIES: hypothetical protein [Caballeronia]|uniref:hypothetical protein n=1 Tax=Caballeronia TaxID=1827195 RepID=UPI001FD09A89|nr:MULTISPECIES: hypothetical protein [Caballeronia]MDR5798976.1 hypothetical protein [Caballeronia sp. LZ001]